MLSYHFYAKIISAGLPLILSFNRKVKYSLYCDMVLLICFLSLVFNLCFTVRQHPLLGSSELFNSFLRKAQQVGGCFLTFISLFSVASTTDWQGGRDDCFKHIAEAVLSTSLVITFCIVVKWQYTCCLRQHYSGPELCFKL